MQQWLNKFKLLDLEDTRAAEANINLALNAETSPIPYLRRPQLSKAYSMGGLALIHVGLLAHNP